MSEWESGRASVPSGRTNGRTSEKNNELKASMALEARIDEFVN